MRWLFSKVSPSRVVIMGMLVVSFFLSIHHRAITLQAAIDTRTSHLVGHLQSVNGLYHRVDTSVEPISPPPSNVKEQLDWVRAQQMGCLRHRQRLWNRMGPIDRYDDQQAWGLLQDEIHRVNACIEVYNHYIHSPWRSWALSRMGWRPLARLSVS